MGVRASGITNTRIGPGLVGTGVGVRQQDQFVSWAMHPSGAGGGNAGRLWDFFAAPSTEAFFALIEPKAGAGFQLRVQMNHDGGTNAVATAEITPNNVWPIAQQWAVEYTYATRTMKLYKATIGEPLVEVGAYITQTAGVGQPRACESLILMNTPAATYDRSPITALWRFQRIVGLLTTEAKTRIAEGLQFIRTENTADVICDYSLTEPSTTGLDYDLWDRSGRVENAPLRSFFVPYEPEPPRLPDSSGEVVVATTTRLSTTNFLTGATVAPTTDIEAQLLPGRLVELSIPATTDITADLTRGAVATDLGWTLLGPTDVVADAAMLGGVYEVDYEVEGVVDNEVHRGAGVGLIPPRPSGSVLWSRGGAAGVVDVELQHSYDGGVTWETVRYATALRPPVSTLDAVVADYELPVRSIRWRAVSTLDLGDGRRVVTVGDEVIATPTWFSWWIRSVLAPDLYRAELSFAEWTHSHAIEGEPLRVPGRRLPVWSSVAEGRAGAEIQTAVYALDGAKRDAVDAVLASGHTLMVTDHLGRWYYAELFGRDEWSRLRAVDPVTQRQADAWTISLSLVEVERPPV